MADKWETKRNALLQHMGDLAVALKHVENDVKDVLLRTWCLYCGTEFELDEEGEVLAAHIRECEKHPMTRLTKALRDAYIVGDESSSITAVMEVLKNALGPEETERCERIAAGLPVEEETDEHTPDEA